MIDTPHTDLQLVRHFHACMDPILQRFAETNRWKFYWSDYHDWPSRELYLDTEAQDGRIYRCSISLYLPPPTDDVEDFKLEVYILIDPHPSLFRIVLRLLRLSKADIFKRRYKTKLASITYPRQIGEITNILADAKQKLESIDPTKSTVTD